MYTIQLIATKINQNDCIDPSYRHVKVSCSDENLNHMQSKYVPHMMSITKQKLVIWIPEVVILKLMKFDVL